MRITDIKVFPVREEKLKAFVSIVLDECFMVNDIKVIKGKEGLFISMPSRRKRNGKFKDVAHPLNNETRQVMERRILAAYDDAIASVAADRGGAQEPDEAPTEPAPVPAPALAETVSEEAKPAPAVEEEVAAEPRRASVAEAPSEPAPEEDEEDKTLEEVAELHLRDSFWGT